MEKINTILQAENIRDDHNNLIQLDANFANALYLLALACGQKMSEMDTDLTNALDSFIIELCSDQQIENLLGDRKVVRYTKVSEELKDSKDLKASKTLPAEEAVTQESRQIGFDNKTTTDDHGMHLYGIAKDQNGTKYYLIKNSWGETGKFKGIWYMSENFCKAKTLNIVVNKKALPKDIQKKLGLK